MVELQLPKPIFGKVLPIRYIKGLEGHLNEIGFFMRLAIRQGKHLSFKTIL